MAHAMQSLRCFRRHTSKRAFDRALATGGRRAFSIVELVVVILIISVLAAVSTPAFMDSLLFHRVESAARRVKADIEYQRQRARLTSTSQTVTFSNGSYTLSGAKSLDDPTSVYTVNLKQSPYLLDSATANFSSTQVLTFDGYGSPSSAGTVVLVAKTHQCTVTINGTTGGATISSNHTNGGTAAVTSN